MNIRTKLTALFVGIVTVVLSIMSISIYYFSSEFRKVDFYRRLKNRAINVAKVLSEVKEVNAALLIRMERNNPASLPNQYIIIYDAFNEELYRSEGRSSFQVDAVMLSEIRKGETVNFETGEYEGVGFLYTVNNERLTVFAAATDVFGREALLNLQTILLITFATCTLLVLCLGWFYAGKVLNPISTIVNDVSNMSGINLSLRLAVSNQNDELGKLSNTFNNMLDRLESVFQSQKAFISNASHEIKTPITVMSGQLEVALLQERNIEYYQALLRKTVIDLKGLDSLSTRLLLLAQSANEQARRTFVALRVDDILWSAKDELTKAHPEYEVDIHFELELQHDGLIIHGDEELLKVGFINLMENGCKYSLDKTVKVQLRPGNNGMITLIFSNVGSIRPNDLPRIFDPFYRAVTSNASGKGFGIGLSLVKSVVNMHRGNVTVNSNNKVTEFVVSLPV